MNIIGKRADGYLVECEGNGKPHSFVAESLGVTLHCPICGDNECSADLATTYIFMQRTQKKYQKSVTITKAKPMDPVDIANDYIYKRHSANLGQ
jgi:hypothetical protein